MNQSTRAKCRKKEGSKFRPLTVVLSIEKIMKEAIRMVPESIYDPEFPDTSHCSSGRGSHSALRRIKEEWGTSRWFLEFDIRKCFHTIDRHRFISFFKEEIDDPKFFYPTHLLFSAGRLVGGEKGPYSVPHSVLLSALPGNIYLHKLDQEIGRIRQKHEIPLVLRIRSVLLRTGKSVSDQEKEKYGEEASFNAPQDNRAIIVGRIKSTRCYTRPFHSLVSSWHTPPTSTPRRRGDQKTPFVFPPALAAFLNKPSSLLCAAFLIEAAGLTPKAEFYGREGFNKNLAMRNLIKYCKRRGLLIELGGEAILVLRSERGLARKLAPLKTHDLLIRICYARYADDLLLGIVGAVELLIEIQKRITHFLQSGLWVGSAGSTTIAARSTVEFPGTVIREVPPRTTPIQFLRELEKRLRVKHRIHITACHLRGAIHSKQATVQVNTFMPKTIAVWFHGHGKSSLSNAMNDLKAMKRQIHGSSSCNLPEVHVKSEWPICLKRGLNVMPFVYEAKGRQGPSDNDGDSFRLHYMPFTAKEAMPLSRPPRAFALSIFSLGSRIPIKELTKGMSGRGYRQIARNTVILGHRKMARNTVILGRERGATLCEKVFDAVQLAPTLGTAGVRSAQVSEVSQVVPVKHIRQGSREISLLHSPRSGRSNVPSDVQQAVSRSGMSVRKFSLYTPAGLQAKGEGGGQRGGSFSSEFPIQINAPIKKILRRLRDRGLISRFRPRPIHVASLTNVSDGDIVNRSAGIAISLLSYYRCCDNLYQVRTIVDHQIRWSAIFTPAHKHKSSARNIIPKYPKDSNIVNQEGGKTLAEFPNSIELGKLGPGFEENNDGALNIMFNK
ncbi:uncharacterized protein LOC141827285 [Curcuma longa]|uniref:uncharacterized protein LOC141827285 n=1 Tax=Curcuma longa TaxID=136217 RepID=UPI003D9DCEFC